MAKKATDKVAQAEATGAAGNRKRLARAKVKRADDAQGERGRKGAESAPMSDAARAKKRKETVRNAIIGVFAVLMALSMMLPSLSTIFSNNNQNAAATEEAEEETEDSESGSESTGMDRVDENYTTTVTPLEEKYKEDPEDLATLLNLGNDYMQWAYAASSYSTDDESTEHVNDLFKTAIDYYDQYLKLNDSNAVRVNRALSQFYGGQQDEAVAALEELTTTAADYGPAWANLGLLYESLYRTDEATEAYKKAAEVDADDEYGAKTFANQRLAAMNQDEVSRPSETLTSTDSPNGLSDVLGNSTGMSNL